MRIVKITANRTPKYAVFAFWHDQEGVAAVFAHRIDIESNEITYTKRLEGIEDTLAAARLTRDDMEYCEETRENCVKLTTKGFAEAVEFMSKQDYPDFAEEMAVIGAVYALYDETLGDDEEIDTLKEQGFVG